MRENPRVLYADASLQKQSDSAAMVATSKGRLIVGASRKTRDSAIAEEAAVALALAQLSVDTVVTDLRKLPRGEASSAARTILSKFKPPGRAIELYGSRHTRRNVNSGRARAGRPTAAGYQLSGHYPDVLRGKAPTARTTSQIDQAATDDPASSAGGIACASSTELYVPCGTQYALSVLQRTKKGTLPHILEECTELKTNPSFRSLEHRLSSTP
ncbi:hypothetical protein HPB50_027682 [Hyalomma asiaticum]|nr:hypothetical protein HPB50_027682 [Hyalomma asiaticum]